MAAQRTHLAPKCVALRGQLRHVKAEPPLRLPALACARATSPAIASAARRTASCFARCSAISALPAAARSASAASSSRRASGRSTALALGCAVVARRHDGGDGARKVLPAVLDLVEGRLRLQPRRLHAAAAAAAALREARPRRSRRHGRGRAGRLAPRATCLERLLQQPHTPLELAELGLHHRRRPARAAAEQGAKVEALRAAPAGAAALAGDAAARRVGSLEGRHLCLACLQLRLHVDQREPQRAAILRRAADDAAADTGLPPAPPPLPPPPPWRSPLPRRPFAQGGGLLA